MKKIYLDVCCLSRPFDDQKQDRIRLESEAVLLILSRCRRGEWFLLGSEVIEFEIDQMPDEERRRRVTLLANNARRRVLVEDAVVTRAEELEAMGFGAEDALHLACAEAAGTDVFLTTDDRLLKRAQRQAGHLRVAVRNPLEWLEAQAGS